ncbi:MAG: InlB B-repeat-containing protein, partial [Bacteroidaceae bacterium]|nr:InlB B-repeat-containing protein [Bacteroidaceae bacterium]
YEWQVQAACGANLTSDWSSLGTFTTEAEPQVTCHEWQLVTSANDLQNGDQIIIAASDLNKAMGEQKTNNRGVADINKNATGNTLELPISDDVQVLTANFVATNNTWTLNTGNGYLYAAGASNNNHLKTENAVDNNGNANWSITISNNVASIVAQGTATRNTMLYNQNTNNPIISCYSSSTSGNAYHTLAIYRLIDNRRLATKDTTVAHALPFTFTMAGQPDTIITSYGEFNLSYVIEADPVNCDSVLNVHLTVNEPMFTVTLNAGAGTITLPAQLTGNSTHSVDLANLVPELDNNCTEWTFAGWSSAAVAETNDAPDFVTTISPTSDTTLYAVYVKSEGGSGDAIWQKANTIAIGDQMVLVYETGKYELSGISTTSTKYGERVSYSVAPTGVYPLTVVAGTAAASYSLKTSDDNYLTWTSGNSLNKASSVTDNSSWSISFDNDGNADIANISQDTRKIRYNTSSPRFACYEGGQSAIQLYKLSNPVVNTYNSNPVCDVNYNITLVQPADGSISSDPAQTASAGAVVTLTATPNAGYTFESWEVRNLATGGTVEVTNDQFTMPAANVEVHASFTAIEYTVTATANPAAGGTITGTGTYSYEGAASLTASANNGYEFVNWTNEQGAVVCTTATYNFIVTRDSALTANFALKEYTITMSVVTGGTLSHNLPANVATMGTEVTLIATPNEGFQFDGDWTVQNISASSPVEVVNNKFTMPAGNVTVTGYFSPITYTVSAVISPDNAGSVSGTGSYNHGAEAQLRATPASGYEFVNWTNAQGAVVSTDADYNFIVNRDSVLTANFELKEYTITMSVVSGGTLSHNLPANVATMGTEVTLIATPNEGFQFDGDWTVQNTSASSPVTVENNKFTMPAGNVTVTGYFSYITYTVSAVVSPANAGSVTGTGSFNHGAEVQLTANPATGYEFVNWTNAQGAVVCTTATYNFNVTSDSALTANFAL